MSEPLAIAIQKKSPYRPYGNDWGLDFDVWLEQRATRKAKPECFWTKKDRELMAMRFDEFQEKVLRPFEKELLKRTKKKCGRCGRPMPSYRNTRKVKTDFCRECNAFSMGKNNKNRKRKSRVKVTKK